MNDTPTTSQVISMTAIEYGIDQCFMVTGGMAMHLNSAFALNPGMHTTFLHNEQSCAMAAEGYYRSTGRMALVCVTAGPGVLNAMNGVFGAFTDSVPMIIVSGQCKTETSKIFRGLDELRQLGDQEVNTAAVVKPIVKDYSFISEPNETKQVMIDSIDNAMNGRPGPVWIDVPVDVQGQRTGPVQGESPKAKMQAATSDAKTVAEEVVDQILSSKRPLIIAGTGIKISNTTDLLLSFSRQSGVPIQTAWTHDIVSSDFEYFAGRPGTIGTRDANLIQQASDLIVVLGSRLNIRQVSYNLTTFSKNKRIIQIDVDPYELRKPFPRIDKAYVCDLKSLMPELVDATRDSDLPTWLAGWHASIKATREKYAPQKEHYPKPSNGINPYHLFLEMNKFDLSDKIFVCGDATATIVPFQTLKIQRGTQLFSNSGCASMGYDLPAAIGAAQGNPDKHIVCLAGDGSIMMNIQELASIAELKNLSILLLDNGGYLSIKQTQSNFFGESFGTMPSNGLQFPEFKAVFNAFGLTTLEVNRYRKMNGALQKFFSREIQCLVAGLTEDQEFEPRLKSRFEDGVITTPELDDMFPFLPAEELKSARDLLKDQR